jgi:hypothetical protein
MSELKITWEQLFDFTFSMLDFGGESIIITQVTGGPHVGTPCYMAHFDSYDGAPDSNHPTGTGATAQEALDAFIEELERRAG